MNAFEQISQTLQNQTQKSIEENNSILLEIGDIVTDFGLKIPRFDTVIPKEEYMIDKRLSIAYKPETEILTSNANNHKHTVQIPLIDGISQITEGDSVLVCWVGADPVIVAVVVSGGTIGKGE
ncbi:hypothetical protein FMM68_04060 [Lachnospiraceae bacterium MD329]|nr:hypothetical protein [Lachnospiraceae bacterium MD329]